MSSDQFDGVTALVTGGARGMGAAEVVALNANGAHVLLADVLEEEGRELAAALGGRVRFVALDVTSEQQWSTAVRIPEAWPPLRALVNNAGVHHASPIETETAEAALAVWKVNTLGPLLGMREVIPQMRACGGGSIVNISSAAGLVGMTSAATYGASKWALRGLSRTAAVELGPVGIRVNCVLPGVIDTPMLQSLRSGRSQPQNAMQFPLGREGRPADLVGAVLFLLSDSSQYVTGAELVVDGGLTAGIPSRARAE